MRMKTRRAANAPRDGFSRALQGKLKPLWPRLGQGRYRHDLLFFCQGVHFILLDLSD
jgi:hypothetical protein